MISSVVHKITKIYKIIFHCYFRRFFVFGGQVKKKVISTPTSTILQQHAVGNTTNSKRRGSDRSLSGSAHELAVCGIRDATSTPRVPHSHSQSNLTDIPHRYMIYLIFESIYSENEQIY